MGRNATKLYYPVKESIQSILPIVSEFYFALGDSDADDRTREEIESIDSDKIKIIDTKWDTDKYRRNTELAHQTDIAKARCSGDWLIYLQSDEVIHERDLSLISDACNRYLHQKDVDAFLFKYYHFWGDYDHYHISHGWYKREIRVVRNDPDIHSWKDAQSFRRIPDFDGLNYSTRENTFKLNVIELDAMIYHYGWVRPPRLMKTKGTVMNTFYHGSAKANQMDKNVPSEFDYGPLNRLARFSETHPAVMGEWINKMDWRDQLQYSGSANPLREKHKHEKFKYRLITLLEQLFYGGNEIGGFKNYNKVRGL